LSNNKDKEKTRVYEYAKSLNMSSKEIITILKRVNMPVNNHMSVMEPEMIAAVEQFFREVKANAAARHAAEQEAARQRELKAREREKQKAQSGQQESAKSPAAAVQPAKPKPPAQPQSAANAHSQAPKPAQGQPQGQPRSQAQNQPRPPKGQPYGAKGHSQSQGRGQHGQRPGGQRRDFGAPGGRPDRQGGGRPGGQPGSRPGGPDQRGQGGFGQRPGRPDGPRPQGGPRPPRLPAIPKPDPSVAAEREQREKAKSFGERKGGKTYEGKDDGLKIKSPKKSKHERVVRLDDERGTRFKSKKGGKGNQQPQKEKVDNTPKKIIVRGEMTVGELAKLLHKDASEVIKKLLFLGVMATINQMLDLDTIQLIADEYKVEVDLKIAVDESNFEELEEQDDPADLVERPPVVTIMGHVDHGKTTLLDAIRSTSVVAGEAGGITQHIGAYQVEARGKKITFLDTPGHEAFTAMRARGAQVTDITILVVAADDGVMPQTVEAINHAKAANVPIIVAVNKIDKPESNPERVKQELTEHGLVPEEWGGDTIFVNVSAKHKQGLDDLLEMILLVAEVRELKANPNKRARGTVIEAELDRGKGSVARVLIQNGTLKVGDAFVAGSVFGRVRTMINDRGKRLKEAPPSTPVEITGMTEVPQAGDPFIVFEDERKARQIAETRASRQRQAALGAANRVTLEDLYRHMKESEQKELHIVLKADVQGSVEALRSSLEKIDVEGARVKIIHAAVGAINESDINLASASNAIVIGFNVRPEPAAKSMAEQEKVDIRLYTVIYNAIEEIEAAMKGLLDPVYKETFLGRAEVRSTFKVSKVGTIAGCMVTEGKVTRNAQVRLVRDGAVVYEGKIESLKRFKDDVREVAQGYECGISIEKFNDVKEGDIIEAYIMETVER
jgi:translation initiation factor IF-2